MLEDFMPKNKGYFQVAADAQIFHRTSANFIISFF
jgi:hypothetical protein